LRLEGRDRRTNACYFDIATLLIPVSHKNLYINLNVQILLDEISRLSNMIRVTEVPKSGHLEICIRSQEIQRAGIGLRSGSARAQSHRWVSKLGTNEILGLHTMLSEPSLLESQNPSMRE
jgi:hypothetical protein